MIDTTMTAEPHHGESPATSRGPKLREFGVCFVTGNYRSGTTWFQRMLLAHPEVLALDEGWFLGYPGVSAESWLNEEAFDRWGSLEHVPSNWLHSISRSEAITTLRRAMINSLLQLRGQKALAHKPKLRWVCDKSTYFYNKNPDRLHDTFPGAVVFDIVRDGRDVVVSHAFMMLRYKSFDAFGSEATAEHMRRVYAHFVAKSGPPVPLFDERSLRYYCERWRESVLGAERLRTLYGERFQQFRYEELFERPQEIRLAFQMLHVDHRPETVERCVAQAAFERSGRKPGQENPVAHARRGGSGDWRNHFTPEFSRVFQDECGDVLNRLGYENGDW